MSRHETIKQQVLSGASDANINFDDLCRLVRDLGFRERTKGSHHIFSKSGVFEIINLQPGGSSEAKSYQVRQVRKLIVNYKL